MIDLLNIDKYPVWDLTKQKHNRLADDDPPGQLVKRLYAMIEDVGTKYRELKTLIPQCMLILLDR